MKRIRIFKPCILCALSFLLLMVTMTNAQDKPFSDNDCDGGAELSEALGDTGQFGFERSWLGTKGTQVLLMQSR
mgnify:CR=1 FL=1